MFEKITFWKKDPPKETESSPKKIENVVEKVIKNIKEYGAWPNCVFDQELGSYKPAIDRKIIAHISIRDNVYNNELFINRLEEDIKKVAMEVMIKNKKVDKINGKINDFIKKYSV